MEHRAPQSNNGGAIFITRGVPVALAREAFALGGAHFRCANMLWRNFCPHLTGQYSVAKCAKNYSFLT